MKLIKAIRDAFIAATCLTAAGCATQSALQDDIVNVGPKPRADNRYFPGIDAIAVITSNDDQIMCRVDGERGAEESQGATTFYQGLTNGAYVLTTGRLDSKERGVYVVEKNNRVIGKGTDGNQSEVGPELSSTISNALVAQREACREIITAAVNLPELVRRPGMTITFPTVGPYKSVQLLPTPKNG